MSDVESELENTRKWARKSCVLQEQQATEIERLNALWACEHETVLRVVAERNALRMQLTRAIPDFVARVNARAEAEMLAGRPITGAHHRAIEAELEDQR